MALAAAATAAVALAGCTAPEPTPAPAPEPRPAAVSVLEQHDLAGLDARQVIDRLDATPVADRPDDLLASVRPDRLVLTDPTDAGSGAGAGATEMLPMPDDEFYLSVAPYRSFTHDCLFHSLTTCVGELGREPVQVTVTDDATGRTVLDESRTTFDNGFVGLWLPRDLTGTLTIEHDGLAARSPISTGGGDLTCLTTMELT